jgi:hypothetical protein
MSIPKLFMVRLASCSWEIPVQHLRLSNTGELKPFPVGTMNDEPDVAGAWVVNLGDWFGDARELGATLATLAALAAFLPVGLVALVRRFAGECDGLDRTAVELFELTNCGTNGKTAC